jgi:hypothetical protein
MGTLSEFINDGKYMGTFSVLAFVTVAKCMSVHIEYIF